MPDTPRATGNVERLAALTRTLGEPSRQLAILGEGNTSIDCGDGNLLDQGVRESDGAGHRPRFRPVDRGAAGGSQRRADPVGIGAQGEDARDHGRGRRSSLDRGDPARDLHQ